MQAQDANHAVLAELNSFFLVKADLALVWPANGEAVDGTPVLQWQSIPGASQYQVVVTEDQAYPPEVVLDQAVQETSLAVTPPLPPGRYSWTVWARDANRVLLAELNSGFIVKASLELLDPLEGAQVGATPTFHWAVFDGAVEYQVVVVNTDALPPEVVFDRVTQGTEMFVDTRLNPEIGYSLTIWAVDDHRRVLAEATTNFTVYATASFFDCANVNVLSAAECQALVTLYQQTGGPAWVDSAGWLALDTPCEWSGVTCTDGHVTDLNLFHKGLNGSLPAELAELTYLRNLALRDNQLSGAIPPELSWLERLTHLDLSRNQLTGSLPAELGQLNGLEFVFLNANQLDGELPGAWSSLAALRHLDLSNNALTGAIPAEWGQLAHLQSLCLGNNQLSGGIPAEIGQLALLSELDVSYNQLSGPVPEAILRLPYRGLWGNQLDGTVRCEGAPPMQISFEGIGFVCFSTLGASVWPEVLPAIPPRADAPFWEPRPEHVRFTLAGAPGAALHSPLGTALSNQAQILIIPAAEYEALDRMIRLQFGAVLELLRARPAEVEGEMPLLPLNNVGQALHAHVRYLDFENGSGVSYLTQYASGISPINNQELLYTFQGVTTDRDYYVAAFFPVALPALPDTPQMSQEDFAGLGANFESYLAETIALLSGQAPEAFTPDLSQIDRLIESLVIAGDEP